MAVFAEESIVIRSSVPYFLKHQMPVFGPGATFFNFYFSTENNLGGNDIIIVSSHNHIALSRTSTLDVMSLDNDLFVVFDMPPRNA